VKLLWENSARPLGKYKLIEVRGYCATCGQELQHAVAASSLAGDAFSRQVEFLNGEYVCEACAWMYSKPTETHRNVFAVGDKIYWPMLSHDSATKERPSWYEVLSEASKLEADTPCIGVLTTDPKPRLWPMTRQRTLRSFGLYVHCSEYDVSEFRTFNLASCLALCEVLSHCLVLGFSKRACAYGLLTDLKKVTKLATKLGADKVFSLESQLKAVRGEAYFLPSLLIAGAKEHVVCVS
jgi:hypothetical protein